MKLTRTKDRLPVELEFKIRELHSHAKKVKELSYAIDDILVELGLSTDIFTMTCTDSTADQTDALTVAQYGNGNIDDILEEILEVYISYMRRKQ